MHGLGRALRLTPRRGIRHNSTIPKKPFYITTPIFYVNGDPHIGHLYSSVVADIIARWRRFEDPNRPVAFVTGTDEHGLKVQKAAADKGIDPQEFCDLHSSRFRDLTRKGNISQTRFIRTTEDVHKKAVNHLWRELLQRGHIYKGIHSGWYSITDECFYVSSQVQLRTDPTTGKNIHVSIETGSSVEWTEEENYKFRLSTFRNPLIQWLSRSADAIQPLPRYNEILSSLDSTSEDVNHPNAFQDISVSRPASRLKWGIPVPDDPSHTIYVWLDALTSYMTASGYPWSTSIPLPCDSPWPADIHLIGKDILRFHTIYFPAFLLALGLPLPHTVLAHAHWTIDHQKMSKSKGNIVDPFQVIDQYGVDAVRYYLARVGGLVDDADWSKAQFEKHYDWDLVGSLGNLFSRIHSNKLLSDLPEGSLLKPFNASDLSGGEQKLAGITADLHTKVSLRMSRFELSRALEDIFNCIGEANRYMTDSQPWAVSPNERVPIIQITREALRIAGLLLQPFIPGKAKELLDGLGFNGNRDLSAAKFGEGGMGVPKAVPILFPKRS